MHRTGCIDMHM